MSNASRVVKAGHAMYYGGLVAKLERELAEARKQLEDFEVEATNAINDIVRVKYQRDTLAEALDLSLGILIALIDVNEGVYDLVVTTTNKNTGEENKMSVRKALEESIAALAAVKGGQHE